MLVKCGMTELSSSEQLAMYFAATRRHKELTSICHGLSKVLSLHSCLSCSGPIHINFHVVNPPPHSSFISISISISISQMPDPRVVAHSQTLHSAATNFACPATKSRALESRLSRPKTKCIIISIHHSRPAESGLNPIP